jgi:hypothetical protein
VGHATQTNSRRTDAIRTGESTICANHAGAESVKSCVYAEQYATEHTGAESAKSCVYAEQCAPKRAGAESAKYATGAQ